MARVSIDDEFMNEMQVYMKASSPAQVTREALTLLNWAMSEVKRGRSIYSANSDSTDVHKLAMPALIRAAS